MSNLYDYYMQLKKSTKADEPDIEHLGDSFYSKDFLAQKKKQRDTELGESLRNTGAYSIDDAIESPDPDKYYQYDEQGNYILTDRTDEATIPTAHKNVFYENPWGKESGSMDIFEEALMSGDVANKEHTMSKLQLELDNTLDLLDQDLSDEQRKVLETKVDSIKEAIENPDALTLKNTLDNIYDKNTEDATIKVMKQSLTDLSNTEQTLEYTKQLVGRDTTDGITSWGKNATLSAGGKAVGALAGTVAGVLNILGLANAKDLKDKNSFFGNIARKLNNFSTNSDYYLGVDNDELEQASEHFKNSMSEFTKGNVFKGVIDLVKAAGTGGPRMLTDSLGYLAGLFLGSKGIGGVGLAGKVYKTEQGMKNIYVSGAKLGDLSHSTRIEVLMGIQTGGENVLEAIKNNGGKDISDEHKLGIYLGSMLNSWVQMRGFEYVLGKTGQLLLKSPNGKITNLEYIKKLNPEVYKATVHEAIKNAIKNVGKASAIEGSAEFIDQMANTIMQKLNTDKYKDKSLNDIIQDTLPEAEEAAFFGAVSGKLMRLPNEVHSVYIASTNDNKDIMGSKIHENVDNTLSKHLPFYEKISKVTGVDKDTYVNDAKSIYLTKLMEKPEVREELNKNNVDLFSGVDKSKMFTQIFTRHQDIVNKLAQKENLTDEEKQAYEESSAIAKTAYSEFIKDFENKINNSITDNTEPNNIEKYIQDNVHDEDTYETIKSLLTGDIFKAYLDKDLNRVVDPLGTVFTKKDTTEEQEDTLGSFAKDIDLNDQLQNVLNILGSLKNNDKLKIVKALLESTDYNEYVKNAEEVRNEILTKGNTSNNKLSVDQYKENIINLSNLSLTNTDPNERKEILRQLRDNVTNLSDWITSRVTKGQANTKSGKVAIKDRKSFLNIIDENTKMLNTLRLARNKYREMLKNENLTGPEKKAIKSSLTNIDKTFSRKVLIAYPLNNGKIQLGFYSIKNGKLHFIPARHNNKNIELEEDPLAETPGTIDPSSDIEGVENYSEFYNQLHSISTNTKQETSQKEASKQHESVKETVTQDKQVNEKHKTTKSSIHAIVSNLFNKPLKVNVVKRGDNNQVYTINTELSTGGKGLNKLIINKLYKLNGKWYHSQEDSKILTIDELNNFIKSLDTDTPQLDIINNYLRPFLTSLKSTEEEAKNNGNFLYRLPTSYLFVKSKKQVNANEVEINISLLKPGEKGLVTKVSHSANKVTILKNEDGTFNLKDSDLNPLFDIIKQDGNYQEISNEDKQKILMNLFYATTLYNPFSKTEMEAYKTKDNKKQLDILVNALEKKDTYKQALKELGQYLSVSGSTKSNIQSEPKQEIKKEESKKQESRPVEEQIETKQVSINTSLGSEVQKQVSNSVSEMNKELQLIAETKTKLKWAKHISNIFDNIEDIDDPLLVPEFKEVKQILKDISIKMKQLDINNKYIRELRTDVKNIRSNTLNTLSEIFKLSTVKFNGKKMNNVIMYAKDIQSNVKELQIAFNELKNNKFNTQQVISKINELNISIHGIIMDIENHIEEIKESC